MIRQHPTFTFGGPGITKYVIELIIIIKSAQCYMHIHSRTTHCEEDQKYKSGDLQERDTEQ